MIPYQVFWPFLEVGEDGYVKGIREDAPEIMKLEYENYLKEEEKAEEAGIKR